MAASILEKQFDQRHMFFLGLRPLLHASTLILAPANRFYMWYVCVLCGVCAYV